jgi:4-hydroxybenzoyl-CoA thioesterase
LKDFDLKFTTQRQVRFSDCDPAGIVFFPQYLVMLNGFVEEWFDQGLGISYAQLIGTRRTGLPTVRLEVDFTAISHHGDVLTFSAGLEKLGRSSLIVLTEVHGVAPVLEPTAAQPPELRLRARQVLVCTSLQTHKAQALPDDVRGALLPYLLAPSSAP